MYGPPHVPLLFLRRGISPVDFQLGSGSASFGLALRFVRVVRGLVVVTLRT